MLIEVKSIDEMLAFGQKLGRLLSGGQVIELVGDVGAGKTTLVKGIAVGLGIDEAIQSPTFTISRVYEGPDDMRLAHYDFYRLHDAGIMNDELAEVIEDRQTVTIIEWAGPVAGVLPDDRVTLIITSPTETSRRLEIAGKGEKAQTLLEKLQ